VHLSKVSGKANAQKKKFSEIGDCSIPQAMRLQARLKFSWHKIRTRWDSSEGRARPLRLLANFGDVTRPRPAGNPYSATIRAAALLAALEVLAISAFQRVDYQREQVTCYREIVV